MRVDSIEGVVVLVNPVYDDEWGYFREWFKESSDLSKTNKIGNFVQGNHSRSAKNVLRGIHFSESLRGQEKLVTCIRGQILDVVVDLRPNSKDFGNHMTIVLSEGDGKSLYIPHGLGHAFLSQSDFADVIYLVTSDYDPAYEKVINPLDSYIAVDWGSSKFILSKKDRDGYSFKDYRNEKGNE